MAKILLAPSLEEALKAKKIYGNKIKATVEAEYGDDTIEGSTYTLAHHGINEGNPAPCNTTDIPEILKDDDIILISHIDLDTVGGILALEGRKINDPKFWSAAEFIDINGPHQAFKFSESIRDSLNAIWAANSQNNYTRYTELTDVTNKIEHFAQIISKALDRKEPEHEVAIATGKDWAQNKEKETTDRCIHSDTSARIFITDGPVTASSYAFKEENERGEQIDNISKATITLNTKTGGITLAFEDGGKAKNAATIMKDIFGHEAGGRAGIAGSPRGQQMSFNDIIKVAERIYADDPIALEKLRSDKDFFDFSKVGYREGSFLYGDSTKDQLLRFTLKE